MLDYQSISKKVIILSNFFSKLQILFRSHYAEFDSASFYRNGFFIKMSCSSEIVGKVLRKYPQKAADAL